MKKRNVMTMALSLAMVGVIGVGSTLAYLTASDSKVTNTFQFANDLEVSLTETVPTEGLGDASAVAQTNGKGVAYTNVVNGQTLPKEPKIELTEYTVDTYVFAKIDNNTNGAVTVGTINGAWTDCGEDAEGNKIYGRLVDVSENSDDPATPLFSDVTITSADVEDTDLGDIVIYVSAIQASGFNDMEAALAAVTTWEATQG